MRKLHPFCRAPVPASWPALPSLALICCLSLPLPPPFPQNKKQNKTLQQGPRSFFSEIISSINDIRFSPCGRYLLSRDYMTLKLWDINMDAGPVAAYPVHESLRSKVRREAGWPVGRVMQPRGGRGLLPGERLAASPSPL